VDGNFVYFSTTNARCTDKEYKFYVFSISGLLVNNITYSENKCKTIYVKSENSLR